MSPDKYFCSKGQHFVLAQEGKYYRKKKRDGRVLQFYGCYRCMNSLKGPERPGRKEK
jgi:hypothetical protein